MNRASSFALFLRLVAPLACACSLVACGDDPVGIVPGGGGPDGGPSVLDGPVITMQPSSSSFAAGSTATFEVTAAGPGPLDYQWLRGGAVIAGATGAKLTLPNVAMTDDKTALSVLVKNPSSSVKSADAILSVTTPVIADSPYPTLCTGPKSTGFCWVTPESGTKVTFADAKNGLLLNGPLIFRTTDAGVRWFLATVNSGGLDIAAIEDVRFLSPTLAVAVGQTRANGAATLRSTDGGATWNQVTSGVAGSLFGVGFSGTKVGAQVGAGGAVAYTADGGASWLPGNAPSFANLLTAVAFASDTVGVAVGTLGTILRTADSGVTWTLVDSGSENYESVKFTTATTAFVASGGGIRRSDDAGLTWTTAHAGTSVEDIAFSDPMHGIATSPNSKSLITADGGTTWTSVTGAQSSLHAVAYADASTLVALGRAIQRSTDGGKTWGVTSPIELVTVPAISGIRYADPLVAVGVGGNTSFGALITRSIDGGGTWTGVPSPTNDPLIAVDFATPKIGAAVGAGVVLRTVDAGATWTVASTDPTRKLWGVRFANDKVGVAVGRQGLVLRTDDAGATWAPLATTSFGTTNALTAVSFNSAAVGVIGDDSGNLFRSTDAGLTWTKTDTGLPGSGSAAIGFANATTVVATGSGGIIRRSTDGGASWSLLAAADPQKPGCAGIRFVTPMLGYMACESGIIKRSTDGGATWTEPFPHLPAPFTSIDFSGPTNGLVGGAFGTILRTTTAGQ